MDICLLGAALLVPILGALAWRLHSVQKQAAIAQAQNDALLTQLREQVALAQKAHEEKTRFLASASHDLRQPMHALGLFAASLEKNLRDTPHHPMVTSMSRAVDALEQSFSSMLDLSKLDAGVVPCNPQTFPIRDVFRRLHLHLAGVAEEKGLQLRFKPGRKLVTSDPELLERALSNLIQNAIRYSRAGGVTVVARQRAAHTSIEVWDTGVGMAASELPRIFEEFYQVGNTGRDRSQGLGMGLAIVTRLVELLGHKLEVQSRVGRGTVFRLLLKTTALEEMSEVVVAADTIPSPLETDRTVLVIDDEAPVRESMASLLGSWGMEVITASDIQSARQAVLRHNGLIDILVCDLRLSHGEDGLDAIAQVRQTYGAPLPAILVTGDTSPEQVKRAHDSGCPVLFKPVRTRELYAALRAAP
jgi:two-component system, sensor histidine kinase